jgi:hypothetical protein
VLVSAVRARNSPANSFFIFYLLNVLVDAAAYNVIYKDPALNLAAISSRACATVVGVEFQLEGTAGV